MSIKQAFNNSKTTRLTKVLLCFVLFFFISSTIGINYILPAVEAASLLNLPPSHQLVRVGKRTDIPNLCGVKIYPDNPFKFNFILDQADSKLSDLEIKTLSNQLIRYFLASLTIPEEDLWVNLSPYEKDQIVPDELGYTDMGRDLLAQDYILKQLVSSLTHPETREGKRFWKKVYQTAHRLYGTTNIPISTFNKIWIVPHKVTIYEDNTRAFIGESRLKVMLEQDYLAFSKSQSGTGPRDWSQRDLSHRTSPGLNEKEINSFSSQIMKEVILPIIEEEVNTGAHFKQLRQIYHALILATWFKQKLRASINSKSFLQQVYIDKKKVKGVDTDDPNIKEKIFDQYVEAYKKGMYDLIKSDRDFGVRGKSYKRRYFSGGMDLTSVGTNFNYLPTALTPNNLANLPIDVEANLLDLDRSQVEAAASPVAATPLSIEDAILESYFKLNYILHIFESKGWWKAYSDLISKMIDQGLITDKEDALVKKALAGLESKEEWDAYSDLISKMIDQGLITDKEDALVKQALADLENKEDWEAYSDLIIKMLNQGLITDKEDALVKQALAGLKSNEKWDVYSALISKMIDQGLITDKEDALVKKALSGLKSNEKWEAYSDLISKMIDQGLITGKKAVFLVNKALADLKSNEKWDAYSDLIITMLDQDLITNKKAVSSLNKALADLENIEWWDDYSDLIIKMFDQGLITDKEAVSSLNKALADLESKEEWDVYSDLIITMLDKGLITDKEDALVKQALAGLKSKGFVTNRDNLIIKIFDKGLITDKEDALVKQALADLENLVWWDVYSNLIITMIDQGLITDKEAVFLVNKSLADLESKEDWRAYFKLIIEIFDKGLITDKEDALVNKALAGLKSKEKWRDYSDLIIKILDQDLINAGSQFITGELSLARENNLSSSYYLKTVQLARVIELQDDQLSRVRRSGRSLNSLIETTNQKAERDDQRIDFASLEFYHLHGLANLQFISNNLTTQLVHSHSQRGYLPLLETDIQAAAELTVEEVVILRDLVMRLESQKGRKPNFDFLMQLVHFTNSYRENGLSIELLREALSYGNQKEVIFNLASGIIQELSRRFDVKVSLDNRSAVENVLKDWNFAHLGSMVSASKKWSGEDARIFKVVLRAVLEGKFKALIHPEEHKQVTFKEYSEEEQEAIAHIQAYNQNFTRLAQEHGLRTATLIHPDKIPARELHQDPSMLRDWRVILHDLRTAYQAFEDWLQESEFASDPDFTLTKNGTQSLKLKLLRQTKGRSWGSLLTQDEIDYMDQYSGLLNQREPLNKLTNLLETLRHRLPDSEPFPEPIADLTNFIQEFQRYDHATYQVQPKTLTMRFWSRLPGRDAVIANQVGSCTRLSQNARAIFEYLLDLGTIYLVLDDPATGKEVGYVRFWIGLNNKKQPAIFIDSADGKANKGSWQPIEEAEEYIIDFTKAVGINPKNISLRDKRVISKLGGVLTEKYMAHSRIKLKVFSQDRSVRSYAKASSPVEAKDAVSVKGGIDLNPEKINMEVKEAGASVRRSLTETSRSSPGSLEKLPHAEVISQYRMNGVADPFDINNFSGFTFEIVSIKRLKNLSALLK